MHFPCARTTVFDYLSDPLNRPQWQSSLRRVSDVVGSPRVGQTWVDETVVGIRPRMRTTEWQPWSRWSETGEWGPVRADLTLLFSDAPGDTTYVDFAFRIHGLVLVGPLSAAATRLSTPAVRSDLRRAAGLLEA